MYFLVVAVISVALLGMIGVALAPAGDTPPDRAETPGETVVPPDADAPANERVVVASVPATHSAGRFTETDRSDLRPRPAETLEYKPDATATATHRLIRGFQPRSYSVYDGGAGDAARPVVILFHEAGRTPLSMIDMWQDTADAEGLLLIAIAADETQWSPDEAEAVIVLDMIDDARGRYPVDEGRILLFGHASGAIMAQYLANSILGPWQAAAVHGGTLPLELIRPREGAVPIRHYLGGSDATFASYDARLSGQALAEAGHDFDLALIPGHTHWLYVGGPAFAADAWAWFSDMRGGDT